MIRTVMSPVNRNVAETISYDNLGQVWLTLRNEGQEGVKKKPQKGNVICQQLLPGEDVNDWRWEGHIREDLH